MKRSAVLWLLFQVCLCFSTSAQVVERSRPEEWKQLVPGARFVDRFLPMPDGIRISFLFGRMHNHGRCLDGVRSAYSYYGNCPRARYGRGSENSICITVYVHDIR